ncbi:proline dehydrogenase family protein [Candidatus Solirubrobacter pratensis]|uniref:proline dehydrogenase family protein n=1 Tax=Candidatus Solirubrobacter pratensis TaxID=1298857 RepID=UPI000684F42F|nr:proline dehydrogenase family protein [Candidatus Solirubrobacter pratensis]
MTTLAPPAAAPDAVPKSVSLEPEVRALGHRIAAEQARAPRGAGRTFEDRGMELLSRDPQLRAALFRLVDVAPACASPRELAEHLAALLGEVDRQRPPVSTARRVSSRPVAGRAVGRAAGIAVHKMAQRFIVGESPADAVPALARLWRAGAAASVDLLGEATVTAAEADHYTARCDEALRTLAVAARAWPERPMLEADGAGGIPRVNLSVKVSAMTPHVRADAPELGIADAAARLRGLLRTAKEAGAHLHIDMESMDSRELINELVMTLLSEPEFRDGPSAGIVLQAYLRDSDEQLTRLLDWVASGGRSLPFTIRLVKGAYWEHETVDAQQHGWTPPVWEHKVESDRSFERLTRRLLDARPLVRPAIASHNVRSLAHAIAYSRHLGAPDCDLELQVLRGLGDDLQHALSALGLRVRTYCPAGDLVAGMSYLVRRLLENTSNDSFLLSRARGADLDRLLVAP